MMKPESMQWLLELTSLPTAAGCEQRVQDWISHWVQQRPSLQLQADRWGNLTVKRRGMRTRKPIYITAHLDHPAFVVTQVHNDRELTAIFRGGVNDEYFTGSKVQRHPLSGVAVTGKVQVLRSKKTSDGVQREVDVKLTKSAAAQVGDVLTWDLPPSIIKHDRLHAPACDDLAGVAAALAAMDELLTSKDLHQDVRLLFTRAEEIGFVGAIAACKARSIPPGARVIALECSRSFAESPLGGGPIVRVGDRTSTFDPALTYRITQLAEQLASTDPQFRYQRRLMPGGTCEATAYMDYGYQATCLCLPLLNYHNMTGLPAGLPATTGARSGSSPQPAKHKPARIGSEIISVQDYICLVRLLIHIAANMDGKSSLPPLRKRLESLFHKGQHVLH